MTKNMLEKRIQELLTKLENLDPDSEEYKKVSANLDILYKLLLDQQRVDFEKEKLYEDIFLERKKIQNDKNRNYIEIGRVLVPTVAGIFAILKITKFEEAGSITTKSLGLINSFFRSK